MVMATFVWNQQKKYWKKLKTFALKFKPQFWVHPNRRSLPQSKNELEVDFEPVSTGFPRYFPAISPIHRGRQKRPAPQFESKSSDGQTGPAKSSTSSTTFPGSNRRISYMTFGSTLRFFLGWLFKEGEQNFGSTTRIMAAIKAPVLMHNWFLVLAGVWPMKKDLPKTGGSLNRHNKIMIHDLCSET